MSIANWIAIFLPIVGLIGGALVYALQKQMDRENEIKRERRGLYRNAAIALERVNQELRTNDFDKGKQIAAMLELEVIVAEVQVSSPDTVADVWVSIPELVANLQRLQHAEKIDYVNFDFAISAYEQGRARALLAMRRDTYGETKITIEALSKVLREMSHIIWKLT